MTYIWTTFHNQEEEDEPSEVYSELDRDRLEVRRVEFFQNGLCFSYGEERGNFEALSKEPFPEDLRSLNISGEREVREISRGFFQEIWNQAQERPDGFMGMFF
nr:hypothetical protein [uncultured Oscillibacter sp.]